MKLLNWITKAFGPKEKYNQAVFPYMPNGAVVWTPDTPAAYIDNGYFLNPDVYAAVQTIINIATTAPINLYEIKDEKASKIYKALCKSSPTPENLRQRKHFKTKALEEVSKHPIMDLLNKPNEWQSQSEFLANMYGFRLVTGNAFVYKAVPEMGKKEVLALYLLPTQLLQIVSGGMMEPVKQYKLINSDTRFEANEVIHNRSWTLDYSYPGAHLFGVSPLRAARRSLTMSNDGREVMTWMLKNTGSKGLLALDPDGLKQTPTKEQMQGLKDDFNENNAGFDKAGKVGITVGKYQWLQMGMSAADLSIIEANKWSQQDICKVFGISPIILGDMSNSTDNNYQHARVSAISNAVIPLLTSVRDSLNKDLLPEFADNKKYMIDFDITVFTELQEDREKQVAYLEKAWWLTGEEKRVEIGYDETGDPNMAKIYIPSSLTPLDQANTIEVVPDATLTNDYNNNE